ncbi:MAG: ATP-binding protein [Candidatus Accumulibacter sp.]|nr:ATP-binding protein [Accumulibacter sp.]
MMLGSPATGENFFGRRQELDDLWRYLLSDHIRFPGVRRLGKTSILKRLVDEAPAHGVLAHWIDVSNVHSAEELIDRLDQAFPAQAVTHFLGELGEKAAHGWRGLRKISGSLPTVVGGGGFSVDLDASAAPTWQKQAAALQERLQNQPLLILLDEFPVMLDNLIQQSPLAARQVLAWLRIWRQAPGECRFVFTGSIGLQFLLERQGLADLMNDPYPYPLGPFKQAEARQLWRHFAAAGETPWQIDDPVIDHALERIGWLSPFFLCLLLEGSRQAARDRRQECLPAPSDPPRIEREDVDAAYELLLAERSRFHHWEKRLKDALPDDDHSFCLALLTLLSRSPKGLTLGQLSRRLAKREANAERRAQRIQDLLLRLTDEGYTSPPDAGSRVQFLSFPLRDWWQRNHV